MPPRLFLMQLVPMQLVPMSGRRLASMSGGCHYGDGSANTCTRTRGFEPSRMREAVLRRHGGRSVGLEEAFGRGRPPPARRILPWIELGGDRAHVGTISSIAIRTAMAALNGRVRRGVIESAAVTSVGSAGIHPASLSITRRHTRAPRIVKLTARREPYLIDIWPP